jgi:type II secretory pathway pseudopilin PulG
VAILTAIAVPGFRKATEDFRFNTVLQDILDIQKACRAYYLIFNEFPENGWNDIRDKLLPFVPRHLIDPNRGHEKHAHRWAHKAFGKYDYHVNNFVNDEGTIGVSLILLMPGTTEWNKYYNKFKSHLGERYISKSSFNNRMFCILPECPGPTDLNSNTLWEDRYY